MKSRNTSQKALLQKELGSFDTFFTAEELFENARKKDPGIGLATAYRFLREMREAGTLYSYSCEGRNVYSTMKRSHCHFTCEETGKIIHFDVDSLDFLKDKIPGSISSFQIEVKGKCKKCSSGKAPSPQHGMHKGKGH